MTDLQRAVLALVKEKPGGTVSEYTNRLAPPKETPVWRWLELRDAVQDELATLLDLGEVCTLDGRTWFSIDDPPMLD